MSDKEREFAQEIRKLQQDIEQDSPGASGNLHSRVFELKKLQQEISTQSKRLSSSKPKEQSSETRKALPNGLRKARMAQVWQLLEREDAMVESASERLHKLNLQLQKH